MAACSPYQSDYLGTWIGIDDTSPNYAVYEYSIVDAGSGRCSVRVTMLTYELNDTRDALVWTSSFPRYFPGTFNSSSGRLETDFGSLSYEIGSGNLRYNGITFVRKAKNTELKFKYVARDHLKSLYPDIPIVD